MVGCGLEDRDMDKGWECWDTKWGHGYGWRVRAGGHKVGMWLRVKDAGRGTWPWMGGTGWRCGSQ